MGDKQEKESKLPVHKYKLRTQTDGVGEKIKERERKKIFKKGEHERKWLLWLRESLIRG